MHKIALWYLTILTVLIPMKFGSVIGLPQVGGYYPEDLFSWIIITWNGLLFPLFSAIGLLLCALSQPLCFANLKRETKITISLWGAAFLTAFLGGIDASCWDFPFAEWSHLGGIFCYFVSVLILLAADKKNGKFLLQAATIGAFLACLAGAEQFFFGFDRQAEYLQQLLYSGVEIADGLQARTLDQRIMGVFGICNSFAGFLLLTGGILLYGTWRFFRQFEPAKVSLAVFLPLMSALWILNYLGTKSRASFMAFVLVVWLCVFLFSRRKTLRLGALLAGVAVIVAGAFYIKYYGRGFDSLLVRIDYSWQSIRMMLLHPLYGTGWGDFLHDYMAMKYIASDEAPHTPHNLLLAFGGQCGIASFLFISAAVIYPLVQSAGSIKKYIAISGNVPVLPVALWSGLTAFFLHSLVDTHLQIPALMSTAGLLLFYLLQLDDFSDQTQQVAEQSPQSEVEIPSATECVSSPQKYTIPFRLGCILYALAVFAFTCLLVRGDYYQSKLEELIEVRKSGKIPVSQQQFKAAAQLAIHARFWSPFPRLTAGDYLLAGKRIGEAEELFLQALQLAPERAATYYRLAKTSATQNHWQKAHAHIDEAIRRFPNEENYRKFKETLPPLSPSPSRQ